MKNIISIHRGPPAHWVGDGFPVRSLFSYQGLGRELSPFLLLDYAGPADFSPTDVRRGVGTHPHRGFETVTIVYEGEVAHRDSSGEGGVIGPGDVQWMTAGAGIVHDEFHSEAFSKAGGKLEMVQLWVNLPARHKMTPPGYQGIRKEQIPVVALPDDAGRLRVIAGDYQEQAGPARTFSPIQVWDVSLNGGATTSLSLPAGWNTALVVLRGTVHLNGTEKVGAAEVAVLAQEGERIDIRAEADTRLLMLSGEPIHEPVVGYGPFVMNSEEEIVRAIHDFNEGRFGVIH